MTMIGRRVRTGRRLACVAALAVLAAGGCATVGPSTARGTAPAASGWISGEAAKQSLRHAAAGAGVGQLAGGAAGYYMDVQEAKLRAQLDGSGIAVTRQGEDLTLSLPGSAAFAGDGADLNPGYGAVLDSVAAVLRQYDKTVIEVAGHADGSGDAGVAQALSERRAAAVAASLERRGVLKSRVITVGAGGTRPLVSGDSAAARARNGRVEVTLAPLVAAGG
jgi:outer membrane protein OmpA-like peptidoglycan-associated protein